MKAYLAPVALLAIAAAALAVNAVLLGTPGCSPSWLTVGSALGSFAPFFVGLQHTTAIATGGALRPQARTWQAAAAMLGVLAIVLGRTFAQQWALACP
jgi:hypothetical protein